MNNLHITGEALVSLCNAYVASINRGDVLSIDSTWSYVCEFECDKLIRKLVNDYKTKLNKYLNDDVSGSISPDDLAKFNTDLKSELKLNFESEQICDTPELQFYSSILTTKLDQTYSDIMASSNINQEDKLQKYLDKDISEIERNIRKGSVYNTTSDFFQAITNKWQEYSLKFRLVDDHIKSHLWKLKTKRVVSKTHNY